MPENKQFQSVPTLYLCGTVMAGVACTRWIPYDWFLSVLGYSISVGIILAILAALDLKNERRAPVPIALILEVLWLLARNAEVKIGPVLWAFLGIAGFVTGILVSALLLPFFA